MWDAWPASLQLRSASLPKKASKKIIVYGCFAKSGAAALSPPACGEFDDGNSVVTAARAHPPRPQVAASKAEAKAACCVVCYVFCCAACLFPFPCVFHSHEQKTCGAVTVVSISSPASITTDRGTPHPGMSVSVLRERDASRRHHKRFSAGVKNAGFDSMRRDASLAACLPRL